MKELLNKLLKNTFIPTIDIPDKLPDTAGAYLICAKNIGVLPLKMNKLEYSYVNELPVVYVGIAGRPASRVKSIRKCDYRNHFNGKTRTSTLRKSLGVLFGFQKECESKENQVSLRRTYPGA